ncbi:AraC family transcriptional regulator [Brachybacterium ginsengisoli]|uniref:AraC family transcriptional regulator n=1 Tax=Brachybacterium ginsengisoli TaxID=1331682 RepID=A0A291GT43_9MICO|nr:helix-turn-helix domain-containing protein [Brachybacterium ginsengisoli]ATG53399.1 AraC family transcriptional regulator [Brachybacterium ginsengisoli]
MSDLYRELPAPGGLGPLVSCVWEHEADVSRGRRIDPDGCVDLIWLAEQELVVAGPDTSAHEVLLPAGRRSSGIRLRPGAAAAVLGLPASELRDLRVPLEQVWGTGAGRLVEDLAAASPRRRLELLAAAVSQRRASPDGLVAAAAQRLGRPRARVAEVAADLGVTERTLHRRTVHAVGYGPKLLARVTRLQRLRASPGRTSAERALGAGYAHQAHMNDEVRRLTGITAVRFLEDGVRDDA